MRTLRVFAVVFLALATLPFAVFLRSGCALAATAEYTRAQAACKVEAGNWYSLAKFRDAGHTQEAAVARLAAAVEAGKIPASAIPPILAMINIVYTNPGLSPEILQQWAYRECLKLAGVTEL